ncbi:MAG TPA: hypothetical protein VMJ34_13355 [Bryobacteraceae bacterium]|nr:hypothetical protein [Bryobacteraceae bacterium]
MIGRVVLLAAFALVAQAQNAADQVDNLKAIIADKDQKIAVLEQEIALLKQNRDLLEQINTQNRRIQEIQKQSIAERDALIQGISRDSRESTVRKLVESIPSIAGIVAVALK